MKDYLKRLARESGFYVASIDRFGIDVDLDLARITSADPLKTIFDVGANIGQTARRFARAFPSADTICSFEPVPASFADLQATVKSLPQVRIFNCALGDAAGTVQISLGPNSLCNSLRSIRDATGSLAVSIDTLDNVCDSNQIDSVDLLKIDVEGFELPVLRGADRRLSSGKIRYIYAECVLAPNAEMPHTSFFELHHLLSEKGFCFVSYYPEGFKLRLGCAVGNVLYALRECLPTGVPGSNGSIH